MLEQLRGKPGSERVAVTAGVFATTRVDGMTLRERWADWRRGPFTDESTSHVSVWEKTASSGRYLGVLSTKVFVKRQ